MQDRTHQESGFTLLEIMLVIFLMGMTVTGVIMTMSSAAHAGGVLPLAVSPLARGPLRMHPAVRQRAPTGR